LKRKRKKKQKQQTTKYTKKRENGFFVKAETANHEFEKSNQ